MTVTDDYLANNVDYASGFKGPLPMPPSKHIAIVACMDARLDVYRMLGIKEGEAHVIRNAGCVVTDDVIRSLAISQRLLGTREIILLHHTDCGMLTFTDDDFKRAIQDETGIRPTWSPESYPDAVEDVRQSLRRIEVNPFVTKHVAARLRLRCRHRQTQRGHALAARAVSLGRTGAPAARRDGAALTAIGKPGCIDGNNHKYGQSYRIYQV